MKLSRQKYRLKIKPAKVVKAVLDHYKLTEEELAAAGKNRQCAEARAYLAWLYLETCCDTLTALGEQLGRDVSPLSSAVRRLQLKAKESGESRQRFETLLKVHL